MILYLKIELVMEDYSLKKGDDFKAGESNWKRTGEIFFC